MHDDPHDRIKLATVSAPDLPAAERAWVDSLGYLVEGRGLIDRAQASSWQTPRQEGRRYTVLAPRSGARAFIRLVEGETPDDHRSLALLSWGLPTPGWSALELTVRDADALFSQLQWSGFTILGGPRLPELSDRIYPMLVQGPAGEVLVLNEVRSDDAGGDLPRAESFVDRLFTVVLAASDVDAAFEFYRRLGFEAADPGETAQPAVRDAFGFGPARRRLTAGGAGRGVHLEIGQLPTETPSRPAADGMLPPAAACVSFMVDSLDGVGISWLGPPTERAELPYHGRRVATCRGTAGELIELIEAS